MMSPHSYHMVPTSGVPEAAAYGELVKAARAAQERYDQLLMDPGAAPSELDAAAEAANAAERLRADKARELHRARRAALQPDRAHVLPPGVGGNVRDRQTGGEEPT